MVATGDSARYRYISTLGSGGMARVDLAEDTRLGRPVALKRVGGPVDPRGLARLRREALAGASLSHVNVVSVYDVVMSADGYLVVVMEYVPGGTLREELTRRHKLPPGDALRVLEGVAAGLDAIHHLGIVHRDVKPSNILLGDDGAVKVADLGIAAVPDRTRITTSGTIFGSLSYMAPEQLDAAPSTPAIDVYALSAVAYEVLSGEKAHPETNPVALAHAIATQPPPDLRKAWHQVPPVAADLLAYGMAKDPGDRPSSAGELVRRLRAALAPEVIPSARRSGLVAAGDGPAKRLAPAAPATDPRPRQVPAGRGPDSPSRGSDQDRQRARLGLAAEQRRSHHRSSPSRLAVAGLLALVAVGVALAIILNSPGSGSRSPGQTTSAGRGGRTTATRHRHSPSTSSSTSSPAAPSSSSSTSTTAGPAVTTPTASGSPVRAVEAFYHAAAAHDYAAAWALADPTLRSQLEGYQSFAAGQAADRSITFDSANVTTQSSAGATVAVQTTSVRDNGTKHCTGTVDLVPAGGGQWHLHLLHINCA